MGGLTRLPSIDLPATARGGREDASADGAGIRVLVIAGYPAVRAGLRALLAREPGILPLGDALGVAADDVPPQVIVVDAGSSSEETLDDLAESYPGARLVLVGGDPAVDGPGLENGPVGYLAPDADGPTLATAVHGVALGLTVIDPALIVASGVHVHSRVQPVPAVSPGEALTAREREVLELVAAGLPNKAIARELGISEHTAKFHVGSLLAKLGAGSRTEAVTLATRRGILSI